MSQAAKKCTTSATALQLHDELEEKASKLSCLLKLLYAEGGESFRQCSVTIQDQVLWLASDIADEIVELLAAKGARPLANGGEG